MSIQTMIRRRGTEGSQEGGGSIGSAAPAYEARNRRVKGFSLMPQQSMDGIRALFSRLREVEEASPQSTRTTLRAFVRRELVEGMLGNGSLPYDVEAAVPAGNVVEGCSMVYFGRNSRERMPEPRIFAEELGSVMSISSQVQRVSRDAAMKRVADAGFGISVLDSPTWTDVQQLLELYREAYRRYTFEINERSIGGMLGGGNIVLVARDGEGIASALIAERCKLRLENGGELWMVELSDYATLRRARGNGLITAMQMEVVDILRSMENGTPSIIYAEDRAAWMAVNKSSARAGFAYCGTLPKHCVLESDRDFQEQGDYENLNVWAAPEVD